MYVTYPLHFFVLHRKSHIDNAVTWIYGKGIEDFGNCSNYFMRAIVCKCATHLWSKLEQESKCVLHVTVKVFQVVASKHYFRCFCEEIKQTQVCFNFYLLYNDFLKGKNVFLIHFYSAK